MAEIKRDQQVEDWLRSHGATFELKEITLFEVNDRRSLQNQARFQPLNEHLVVTYAEAMEDGAQFPPIVVTKDAVPGGLLILDGNHRHAAARLAGKERLAAYVTKDLTERQVMVLTFDANTKHGLPTTTEERRQHAVYLVETAGIQQKDAAKMLSVPLRELQNELSRVRSEKRMIRLGIERWESLPKTNRMRLDNVRDDTVFKEAADVVIQSKMGWDAINVFVNEINATRTQADAFAVVEAERERRAEAMKATIGGRAKRPVDFVRLTRSLSYAERVAPERLDPAILDNASRAALVLRIDETLGILRDARERLAV